MRVSLRFLARKAPPTHFDDATKTALRGRAQEYGATGLSVCMARMLTELRNAGIHEDSGTRVIARRLDSCRPRHGCLERVLHSKVHVVSTLAQRLGDRSPQHVVGGTEQYIHVSLLLRQSSA